MSNTFSEFKNKPNYNKQTQYSYESSLLMGGGWGGRGILRELVGFKSAA